MDSNLILKSRCDIEGKNELLKTISILTSLCLKARQNGILSLNESLKDIPDDFMKIGVKMLISGFEPALVERMLMNILNAENPGCEELLKKTIIVEGIMALYEINPTVMVMKLLSYLGEKIMLEGFKHDFEIDVLIDKYDIENNKEAK